MEIKNKERRVSLFLRIGLAFVFLYVGFQSFLNPNNWIGFIPGFLDFVGRGLVLKFHAGFDLLLGLWLLSNKKIYLASVISSIFLFGIILFNLSSMDLIFRDVAILFMALSLAILTRHK